MTNDDYEVLATILIAVCIAVWAGAATEIVTWFNAVVFVGE
jgi:hypothetical protein